MAEKGIFHFYKKNNSYSLQKRNFFFPLEFRELIESELKVIYKENPSYTLQIFSSILNDNLLDFISELPQPYCNRTIYCNRRISPKVCKINF